MAYSTVDFQTVHSFDSVTDSNCSVPHNFLFPTTTTLGCLASQLEEYFLNDDLQLAMVLRRCLPFQLLLGDAKFETAL